MRKSTALSFAAIAVAAVVAGAGCSGSGNTASPGGTPTPVPVPTAICTAPAGYTIQQVFPQQNASAAPNLQGVVFAVAPGPLPTNWYFYVTSGTSATAQTNTTYGTVQIGFLATPSPQPTASPSASPSASPVATGTPLPTPSDKPTGAAFAGPFVYEIASIGNFATSTTFVTYLANSNCAPSTAAPNPLKFNTFTTDINNNPSPSPVPSPTATST